MKPKTNLTRGLLLTFSLGILANASAADDHANPLISLLEAGKPVIGVWTGALSAPRIAKVHATSDLDFIVADVEHDIYDFNALHRFLLEVQDFSHRYRTQPRPAPVVLIKLGHRGMWDPRYEIATSLKVGPSMGMWLPFVESRADVERAISAIRDAETSTMAGVNIPKERRDLWPLNPKGEMLLVAMIESEEGVRNAKEIVETPGLSAVHTVHISEQDAQRIHQMCLEQGVISGTNANASNVKAKVDAGYKLISLGWDFGILRNELKERLKRMRSALSK